ncbi:GNAT family N-acetyltransferase [Bacillus sp. IB182487]|uniref:GNAT family N-acetyltransferase n=2 Tax=Metabacillus arenae TaxID=2771434 RepID=A0A926NMW3_9BACI|nr:GNAT family N-acetyltransferase [Metabacillus arenae]
MDLLLLADESEEMINSYIHKGSFLILEENNQQAVGVILLLHEDDKTIEIKNISILEQFQGKGLGRLLIKHTEERVKLQGVERLIVGTANSSIGNIAFYQKLGFRMYDIRKDFFLDYPEIIYENGIQAQDMIMFKKLLN